MTYDTSSNAIDGVKRMTVPVTHMIRSIAPPYDIVPFDTISLAPGRLPGTFTRTAGGKLADMVGKTGAGYDDLIAYKGSLARIFSALAYPAGYPYTASAGKGYLSDMLWDLSCISGVDPTVMGAYIFDTSIPLGMPMNSKSDAYAMASDLAGALGTVLVDHDIPKDRFMDMMGGDLGDAVVCCLACAATHPDTPSMALGDLRAAYAKLHPDAK